MCDEKNFVVTDRRYSTAGVRLPRITRLLDCGSKVSISERRHRFGINLGALLQPQKAPSSGLPRMFHNLAVLA